MKRSSLRVKMRHLANCQVRHTQAGDKYLSEKKQSGCHNNKSSTYAGKTYFSIFFSAVFYGFYLKESFFSFLINFNFFSLRLNWVLGRRAGWWLDERNHPAYVMTNQLTKCVYAYASIPFLKNARYIFSFSQNTIFRPPIMVVRPRPRTNHLSSIDHFNLCPRLRMSQSSDCPTDGIPD